MAIIEHAIEQRFTDATDLTDLLASSTSFYAVIGNADEPKPYITFRVMDEDPNEDMSGDDSTPTQAFFEIKIIADTLLEISNISEEVKTAFKNWSGTAASVVVQAIYYQGRNDFHDQSDRDYQRTMDFLAWFEE